MIEGLEIGNILTWILAAFFIIGGIVNWIAPKPIRKEYARWGYPSWFHYVTAILEIAAAALLIFPETKLWGCGLGAAVMAAALGTLVIHREYAHGIAPAMVFILSLLNGWMLFKDL
ncbi:MAG: DoxX family protein [Micavibrio aeruginosavorus]|uniref:DoxX family protein n=1 Tax=Micavibrio aeruginosavorus TaxID=349221 RepID=A0A2W5A957_9BACT|nr:MAG: DoxX family protein [Micavibrio aeruginosavorus]